MKIEIDIDGVLTDIEQWQLDYGGKFFSNFNKMNIENIMIKYDFKEVIRIKEYWGYRFLNAWCKESESTPCKCTNVIFVKELKKYGN